MSEGIDKIRRKDVKYIIKASLKNKYGFEPKLREIELIRYNKTGTWVIFKINNRYYRFISRIIKVNGVETVYTGDGTVKMVAFEEKKSKIKNI